MKPVTFDLIRKSSTRDDRVIQGARTVWSVDLPAEWGDLTGYAGRAMLRDDFADYASASFPISVTLTGTEGRTLDFVFDDFDGELNIDGGRWDCEVFNGTVVIRTVMGAWQNMREATR
ncbi:MAG: hypothetical protein EKK62_09535 [Acidimicrobiia bacterium]|nr:MAG: hypothetical protein EKK62_09535 [Acidimicrobiia bacterium]